MRGASFNHLVGFQLHRVINIGRNAAIKPDQVCSIRNQAAIMDEVAVQERNKWKRPARVLGGSKSEQEGEKTQPSHTSVLAHSITSSAGARNTSGMVNPIALAVLRLTTNSNLTGCSIGRSAGLAPCKILCAYTAPRRNKSGTLAPYDMKPPATTISLVRNIPGRRLLARKSMILPMLSWWKGSFVIKNASGRSLIIVAKASANSSDLRTARGSSFIPNVATAPRTSASWAGWEALSGFQRKATREREGITSFRSCNRLPATSGPRMVLPVILPPGRL